MPASFSYIYQERKTEGMFVFESL